MEYNYNSLMCFDLNNHGCVNRLGPIGHIAQLYIGTH